VSARIVGPANPAGLQLIDGRLLHLGLGPAIRSPPPQKLFCSARTEMRHIARAVPRLIAEMRGATCQGIAATPNRACDQQRQRNVRTNRFGSRLIWLMDVQMPDIGRRRRWDSGEFRQINCRLDVPLARLRSRTDETAGSGHVPDWRVSADLLFGTDNPRMFGFSTEQICGICSGRTLFRFSCATRSRPAFIRVIKLKN